MKHLIFTESAFISPRWALALPDARINTDFTPFPTDCDLIWIVAGCPNWVQLISFYSEQRKAVIALTKSPDLQELQQAFAAGAKGYLDALANTEILKQAAQSVTLGAVWVPPGLLSGILGALSAILPQKATQEAILATLTLREKEVVHKVLKGYSNKMVARELNITERTVKEHMSSIFSKLKVHDRLQLMSKIYGTS